MSPLQDAQARQKALALLGLAPGAAAGDVRRAYRKLVFDCHPDRHPGRPDLEQRFKLLSDAYRTLLQGAPLREETAPAETVPPVRGRDVHFRIRLDFLQAARGGEIPVRFTRAALCPACEGRGDAGCGTCGGRGEVLERAVVTVRVLSGVEDGETLCVAGEGGAGRFGGPAGDLYINVSCGGHPTLRRAGMDIYGTLQVPAFRLREGGPIRVFTVWGGARIEIPPRTSPGRVIRLRGWGIRREIGGRAQAGDHIVRLVEMTENAEAYAQEISPRYRFRSLL